VVKGPAEILVLVADGFLGECCDAIQRRGWCSEVRGPFVMAFVALLGVERDHEICEALLEVCRLLSRGPKAGLERGWGDVGRIAHFIQSVAEEE